MFNIGFEENAIISRKMPMLYPLYVWKDTNGAYGASFPDLPGVNTVADQLDELPAMAQEAVECMYDGSPEIPKATTVDNWKNDPVYKDGFWMAVEIDLGRER
jgi:predicted RNase H-like HicB family nuclease